MPNTSLIAHVDVKLLLDTDGDLIDWKPIVISEFHIEKLLAAPRLSVSTDEFMGNTVIQILKDWKYVPAGFKVFVSTQVPTLLPLQSLSRHLIQPFKSNPNSQVVNLGGLIRRGRTL